MTLHRRALLSGLAGLALARPALSQPQSQSQSPSGAGRDLAFRVLRNDSQIGTHTVSFTVAEGRLTARISTDVKVGVGPITVYRYTHRAEERWQAGTFLSLDAETNDNGTQARTTVRREAEWLDVQGQKAPRYQAPLNALPLTHWNQAMLDGPVISSQTGELLRPVVTRIGPARVQTAAGPVEALHVTLRGDPELDTWYDEASTWLGLRLTARDGSTIRYERG